MQNFYANSQVNLLRTLEAPDLSRGVALDAGEVFLQSREPKMERMGPEAADRI